MKEEIKKIIHFSKRTYPLLKPYMGLNIVSLLLNLISTALQLFFPLCIQYFIDDIAFANHWDEMLKISLVVIAVIVGKQLSGYFACVLFATFSEAVGADARKELYKKVINNKLSFFYNSRDGEIITRITEDSQYISSMLSYVVVEVFANTLQIVLVLGILFNQNVMLASMTIVTIPIYVFLNKKFGDKLQIQVQRYREKLSTLTGFYIESIRNIKHIKNFVIEAAMEEESNRDNHEMRELQINTEKLGYRFNNLMKMSVDLNKIVVLILGGFAVAGKKMTVGSLMAYMTYTSYIYEPFMALTNLRRQMVGVFVSLERYFAYFDDEFSCEDRNEGKEKLLEIDNIVFKDVKFKYEEQTENVLHDVAVIINKKDKIHLCGRSGQGKSTFCSMLKRFYDCTDGDVIINGRNILEYDIDSVRKRIFYLSQEMTFFDKSIRDNFLLLDNSMTDQQIEECLKRAQIYEELFNERCDGLDTVLSKSGSNLSGGQRQRLQLALLFALDFDVAVLDEPFTGIDDSTVQKLWKEIKKYLESKTVIMIDHNFSDENYFTRKICLENGTITRG